jgi:primosomal protein DnaI
MAKNENFKSIKELAIQNKVKPASNAVGDKNFAKYLNSPLVKPLNLTSDELRKFAPIIKQMVDEDEKCRSLSDVCSNPTNHHIALIRINDELEVVSIPCEKMERIVRIKPKYLIRNFANNLLNVKIDSTFFKKVDPTKEKLLNLYYNMVKTNHIDHGIYVYGAMGIGKTFTSIALANEFANLGHTIAFVFVPDIVYELKQGFNKESSLNNELVDKMKNADILFLDDIGAEDTNMWFYNEYLLIVLNYRMQNDKPTFFNSNLCIEDFHAKLYKLMNHSLNAKKCIVSNLVLFSASFELSNI